MRNHCIQWHVHEEVAVRLHSCQGQRGLVWYSGAVRMVLDV
jgi:hypothetical protein